jgi:hypothetical protein
VVTRKKMRFLTYRVPVRTLHFEKLKLEENLQKNNFS